MAFFNNKSVRRDPLGPQLTIDQSSLEGYLKTDAGAHASALRGARVFQANDRPGYSPDPGITELYAGYYNYLQEEQKRLQAHEEYVALSQERPGRKANILGGSGDAIRMLTPVLGGGVA